jgi:hypothetical protein
MAAVEFVATAWVAARFTNTPTCSTTPWFRFAWSDAHMSAVNTSPATCEGTVAMLTLRGTRSSSPSAPGDGHYLHGPGTMRCAVVAHGAGPLPYRRYQTMQMTIQTAPITR